MSDAPRRVLRNVAVGLSRREFVRKSSAVLFGVFASMSVGHLPALAYPSSCAGSGNTGIGCPSGGVTGNPCGPSRCCASHANDACKCSNQATCKDNSDNPGCRGKANTWGGQACWTCTGPLFSGGGCTYRYVTTCCDCKTVGCGDASGHCIGYRQDLIVVSGGPCPTSAVRAGAAATADTN